jgi:hypothetical protein
MADRDRMRGVVRAAVLVAFLAGSEAHADLLLTQTRQVYGQSCRQAGQTVDCATPISVAGAGTMQVRLADLDFGARFAELSFALFSGSTLLQTLSLGSGPAMLLEATSLFQIAAGAYTARVYPVTQGPDFLGAYSLRIDFTPAGPPVVPLPPAVWLLLSGLLGLAPLARAPRPAS